MKIGAILCVFTYVANIFPPNYSLDWLTRKVEDYMFEIDEGRVGFFRVRMDVSEVEESFKYHVYGKLDTAYINFEGQDVLCYKIIVDSEYNCISLVMDSEGHFVEKLEVFSDRFKTKTGIGIGDTYGEFTQISGNVEPVWDDRGQPVLIAELQKISFLL
ncbi:hypothetical protein JXA84_09435 [candidate division WOR-3 bacterium]|nr:hypothetical protein [candidate division WOR-3 bacterium]